MSSSGEKAISQIEEIRWRDQVLVQSDGREIPSYTAAAYAGDLGRQLKDLMGNRTAHCMVESAPGYVDWVPGTTVELHSGVVPVVQKDMDPNWFILEKVRDNIRVVSLGAKGKAPVVAQPKATKPEELFIDLVGGEEEKARQAALTKARLDNMRAYEQQQVQGLVSARKNAAADKAALDKLKAYLRERGSKQ